jgi:hypothetical protein
MRSGATNAARKPKNPPNDVVTRSAATRRGVEDVHNQRVGERHQVRNTPDRRVEWVAQAGARAIEEETVHLGQERRQIRPARAARRGAMDEQDGLAGAELLDADLRADPRQAHPTLARSHAKGRPQVLLCGAVARLPVADQPAAPDGFAARK